MLGQYATVPSGQAGFYDKIEVPASTYGSLTSKPDAEADNFIDRPAAPMPRKQ